MDSLPSLEPALGEDLLILEKQFGEINVEVDQVFHFLKNPNEKVIEELKQKFDTAENEAKNLERELFQKLSEPGTIMLASDFISNSRKNVLCSINYNHFYEQNFWNEKT